MLGGFVLINKHMNWKKKGFCRLLVLLGAKAGASVGQLDGELAGTLDNVLALLGRHRVRDLAAKASVHHHQHLQLLG